MEISQEHLEQLRETVKTAQLEALIEFDQYKKKKAKGKDPDLISTTEAYRLRGRARVDELLMRGLLKRFSSGRGKTSAKYVSKKKLFSLDKVIL